MDLFKTSKDFILGMSMEKYDENSYIFHAKDIKTNKVLGYVSFTINRGSWPHAWMRKIEVYDSYQRLGIGQVLLNVFEHYCVTNNIDNVEGKYYPSNAAAIKFYQKNGYSVTNETYGKEIFKSLSKVSVNRKYNKNVYSLDESVK